MIFSTVAKASSGASTTLSTCSWSSAKWILAPASLRRYWTSAIGLVGYMPVQMLRIATVAKSKMIHSGRSSEWIDVTSPGWTPSARRPCAAVSTSSQSCALVRSCQTPKSLSRMATRSGVVCAHSLIFITTVGKAPERSGVCVFSSVVVMCWAL